MAEQLWSSDDGTLEVRHDSDNRFFEILEAGRPAGLLVYELRGSHMTLTHTAIEKEFVGRGLAPILIRESLKYIGGQSVKVTNRCPVVDRFIAARPEFASVITPSGS
jgi:predicted GNAT family acetyltransferase